MKIREFVASILNFIIRALLLVAIIYGIKELCLKAYDYGYRIYSEPPMAEGEGVDIVVEIPMGCSAADTGKLLKEYGLIRDDKLEPGTYVLSTSMTAEEMMKVMSPSVGEEDSEEDG